MLTHFNVVCSVVEFPEEEDVDEAFKVLDGAKLNGNEVKLLDNMVSYRLPCQSSGLKLS